MTTAWTALGDPHRRALLELLLGGPRAVGELVERTELSQPSTSKHLRVLREAGLVSVRRDAQRRVYALEPRPIAEIDAWLAPYRRLWSREPRRARAAPGREQSEGGPLMEGTYVTLDGKPAVRFERTPRRTRSRWCGRR